MCAPGSTGQLSLFIGDRAHIPMYIALSRSSCTQAQHLLWGSAKASNSTHSSTVKHREDCRRSTQASSGCSVTLSPGGARPNRRHSTSWSLPMQLYAIDGRPISGTRAKHHWWRETLWWCPIVVRSNRHHGGINQLLAEQIRAPGSRGVLASQAGAQDSTSR